MDRCMKAFFGALLAAWLAGAGIMADAKAAPPAIHEVPIIDVPALAEQGAVVIDVRRPDEWRATGIIPGSLLITAFDRDNTLDPRFIEAVQARVKPDQPVVLVCRSGNRSGIAARLLAEKAGYQTLYNAQGGMLAWAGAGRPTAPCPSC